MKKPQLESLSSAEARLEGGCSDIFGYFFLARGSSEVYFRKIVIDHRPYIRQITPRRMQND